MYISCNPLSNSETRRLERFHFPSFSTERCLFAADLTAVSRPFRFDVFEEREFE